jgi:hypothetical protein
MLTRPLAADGNASWYVQLKPFSTVVWPPMICMFVERLGNRGACRTCNP